MLNLEQINEIHRLAGGEHCSIRRIAHQLRLAARTVKKYLVTPVPSPVRRPRPSKLASTFSVPPAAFTAGGIFFRLSPAQSLGMSLVASRTAPGCPVLARLPGCFAQSACSSMQRRSSVRALIQVPSRKCPAPITCLACRSFDHDSRLKFRTQDRRANCACKLYQR